MLQTIFLNLIMGIIGILVLTLWESKKYIFTPEKEWIFSVFVSENIKMWIWLVLFISVLAIVSGIMPESLTIIKSYTGIDLIASPAGFLTLGITLKAILKN